MEATIDGVMHAPTGDVSVSIRIATATHNRPEIVKRSVEQHMTYLRTGALVVVVDDGSKPTAVVPDVVQLLCHETSL